MNSCCMMAAPAACWKPSCGIAARPRQRNGKWLLCRGRSAPTCGLSSTRSEAVMRTLLIAVLGVAVLAGPARALPDDAYVRLNEAAITQHVQPRYQAFASAVTALRSATEVCCKAPAAAGLPALQQAYRDAAGAWQDIQHVRFGPVELFF